MAPYQLPLFPLSVVLFPGTPLPLHIFEPRYRKLLSDCLAGDRRFGLTPTGESREAPDPGAVGCVAEVRANELLPDGQSNIMVLGRSRFAVRGVIAAAVPYHVGLVEEFDELPGTAPSADLLGELRTKFEHYYAILRQLHDVEPEELTLPAEALPLSFAISAAIECDAAIKRRLLATRSTDERVRLLLQILPTLGRMIEGALRVHRRAHTNGKGGAHSVLPSEP